MNQILVESSMRVLTSIEFQTMVKGLNITRISAPGLTWTPGTPTLVDLPAQEIKSVVITAGREVSLKQVNDMVRNSPFQFSLLHIRRPGQPIGTTIEYNEAIDQAKRTATKQALPKPLVPFKIKPDESTAIAPAEQGQPTFTIQETSEGRPYVDLMKPDSAGGFTFWRILGGTAQQLEEKAKHFMRSS